MPGALTHIAVAVLLATAVHMAHFRPEFSLSIFIGSLLPDAIKFGFSSLRQLTWNLFGVDHDAYFHSLANITGNITYWLLFGLVVVGTFSLLYNFHFIKKKELKDYNELYFFILAGVVVHILLDAFFHERNLWF